MKILNEKLINRNKAFSYPYGIDNTYYSQYVAKMNNTSGNYVLLNFGFDDGKENIYRLFTGSVLDNLKYSDKLNEDLDSINLELIDDEDNPNALDFKIPNRSRIRISIDSGATYFDMVVASGNFAEKTINGKKYYFHAYNFVEAIYLWKYVILPNNSFSSLTTLTKYDSDGNEYTITQADTNCYDALERILRITEIDSHEYQNSWYSRVDIDNSIKTRLQNSGVGKNFTFNSNSLYNIVFKIFNIAKMYPVLTFNKIYGLFGKEFILKGIDIDGNDDAINEDVAFENCNSFLVSDTSEKQASKVVTNATNMVSSAPLHISGQSLRLPIGQTIEGVIVPESLDEYKIKLRFDGAEFEKIKIHFAGSYRRKNGTSYTDIVLNKEFPILDYIEWQTSSVDVKRKTAYYQNGEIGNIGTIFRFMFYTEVDSILINELNFEVFYTPILNAKVVKGDSYGWEEMVDQEDSSIDSQEYGNYLTQYAKFNSGVNIQFRKVETVFSKIYAAGQKIKSSYGDLVINNVEVTMHNNCYDVSYNATIDVPQRSENIGYDGSVRNTYIDRSLSLSRDITFHDKLKLKLINTTPPLTSSKYVNCSELSRILFNHMGLNGTPREYMFSSVITAKNDDTHDAYNIETRPFVVASSFGNSLLFQIKYDESYYNYDDRFRRYLTGADTTVIEKYTNEFGKIDIMDLEIDALYKNTSGVFYNSTQVISINDAYVYKDSYEVPTITVQVDIDNAEDDLCDLLLDNNRNSYSSFLLTKANNPNEAYSSNNVISSNINLYGSEYVLRIIVQGSTSNSKYFVLWGNDSNNKKHKLATFDKVNGTTLYLTIVPMEE